MAINVKVIGLTHARFELAGSGFEPAMFRYSDHPAWETDALFIVPPHLMATSRRGSMRCTHLAVASGAGKMVANSSPTMCMEAISQLVQSPTIMLYPQLACTAPLSIQREAYTRESLLISLFHSKLTLKAFREFPTICQAHLTLLQPHTITFTSL